MDTKLVFLIGWTDAWITTDDAPDQRECLSWVVGWIRKEKNGFIYISNFYDGISGKLTSPWTAIPKKLIKVKKKLMIKEPE